VVKADKFGNLITNIGEADLLAISAKGNPISILIAGQTLTRICRSYAEGGEDEVFAIIGSSGYLELAAKQASAAEKLAAGAGSPVGVVVGDIEIAG
jgi:S-adenosyl-L-methionine hydrolase (adenosine-forming)